YLVGGAGNDTILGGTGNDSIEGGTGNDSLDGGSGSDTFVFSGSGLGSDVILEPAGNVDNDWLDFSGFTAGGVNIDLSQSGLQVVNAGNLLLTLGNSSAIEHVLGTNAADNIVGNAGNNILIGLGGNDVIDGGAGNDTIDGGLGNDLLLGGIGDDSVLGGAGNDTLNGGAGNDTLVGGADSDRYLFTGSSLGSDSILEAPGCVDSDTLDFSLAGFAININLGLTTAQTVIAGNLILQLNAADAVENVDGSAFNDVITGNGCGNILNGNDGNDSILGLGGNDTIDGGLGNDTLLGGSGNDTVLGGPGNDLVIWNPGDGNQFVDGGTGTDTVQINGSNAAGDNFVLQQHGLDPTRQVFSRTNLTPFTMNIGTVEVYDVNSQGGDDTVTVFSPISGTGNGDVTTFNLNTGTGNDLVVFDFTASNLLPTTSLTGGTGNDVLRIEGGGTPFTNETYSSTGPDSGTINLDGQVITFSLMERLQQTKAGTNLLFQATGGNDSIGLTDGPTVNGFPTSSINSLNNLFVGLDFANKVFATVSGMGGVDSFTLTNPNPAAGLTQWTVNGGTTASAASDADTSGDVFKIQPTSIPINVNGGKPVNVYPGDRLDILPPNPGQSLTLTGKHDGTYTFTGLAPVNFTSIEDFSGIQIVVVGTDYGSNPRIRVYSGSDTGPAAVPFLNFRPFADLGRFRGGVRVAAGDVNGDGYPDIIAACGPGTGGSLVRVFDGYLARLGVVSQIGNFRPFGNDWNKGLYVAVGDLNSDGFGDIVVGTGGPAKAQVRVFSGADVIALPNPPRQKFNAFPSSFRGGCNVAVGDYDGDGRLDIIVGAGASSTPRVRVFDGTTFAVIDDFLAFDAGYRRGIYVGAADVDNDGIAEIIVSRNVSGLSEIQPFDLQISPTMNVRPEVRTFDFTTNQGGGPKTPTATAEVFPANYTSGVRLGGYSDGGDTGRFLAVNGPGVAPGLLKKLDATLADSLFTNYAAESSGFFVAGSQRRFGLPLP
ncbi:MAG: FG-GAP-like repeat-containing protein, partial [Gemmatales bacterium]|nr:FG-GAP-like repeat-containing protein [Gemmatales bacterium]MDW8386348.1 FG-GAP-like repeat-containing protein [Gemmatales bacterium]